jgi:ATP-dependent helicase/nuclease subunit B
MEQEDVLRYLKTGLSPVDRDTCDALENYAVVWNLRGSRWAAPLTAHPDGYGLELDETAEAMLQRLNAGREAGIVPLLDLQEALKAAKNTGELVLALYHFIEQTGLEQRLEELAQRLIALGRQQEAMEHLQLYGIVSSALEQFYGVLGQTVLTPAEFARMLELQLSQYDVGTIPVTLDAVLCGTILNLRNRSPKYLLVLGACDGEFPSGLTPSGILSEEDRQQLELYGIQLAADLEGRLDQDLAAILSVLSSPEKGLFVSYSTGDGAPAYLYQRLCALFPDGVSAPAGWQLALYRPETTASLLARHGGEAAWRPLEALCQTMPQVTELADRLRQQASREPGPLSRAMVEQLWGNPTFLSASRLESYAACHHAFFLRYGLKAQDHVRAAFDAPVFGTFVHYVLEHTARQVREEGGFARLSEQRLYEIADSYIDRYTNEEMHGLEGQSDRFVYLYNRNLAEVRRVVDSMASELRVSDFRPEAFELNFAPNADVPPYRVETDQAIGEISGFVDRVDVYDLGGVRYVRVVDYKTGKKAFDYTDIYQGMGLQMLIYLFALERSGAKLGRVTPTGVLYMPARSAILSSPVRLDAEAAEKSRKKELKRHGILTDDDVVLNAMEHCDGSPTYLPFTVKKDGSRSGDLMDREQMQLLRRHVDRRLRELLDQMATGQVSPNPYFKGPTLSACTWCDYAATCHPAAGCRRYFAKHTYKDFWDALQELEDRHG